MPSVLFSEFCDFLGKIHEIDHESPQNTASVVLTPESRRLSLCLDLVQLKMFQVVLPQRTSTTKQGHHFLRMLADSERSTAEGNLQQIPNQQTTKAVAERANGTTANELVRLCKIADYAEIQKIGEFFQTRHARNSAGMPSILRGEADKSTSVESGQLLRSWKQILANQRS